MGIFNNLTNDGLEETQDRLGGGFVYDTDAYDATIKLAYAGKSKGGATSLSIVAEMPGGKEYKETLWVTNKKGENFFLNKQDNSKKVPLPGFTVADDICLCTTEKPLADQDTEDKVVNIYDFDAKKELPTSVPVLTELLGKVVTLGVLKQLEDKTKDDGQGNYVPTGETKETNTIDKVFHTPTKLTMVEVRNGVKEAAFYGSWVERNQGKTRDRTTKDAGGKSGAPRSGPPQSGGTAAPRKSLFGNS